MDSNGLEVVMGQLELSMERHTLVEDDGMSSRGTKRPHSRSAMFNAVNGHSEGPKRVSDQYDLEMGFVNRGVPSRYLKKHRNQISIDEATLLLNIETAQKAEAGKDIRRKSLGRIPAKADVAADHVDKEEGKANEKKLKKKRKQEKAKFLDWKMPELR